MASSTSRGPAIEELAARFRLVLLDNRGSGRSDPPPQTVKIADMVRDVVAVLDDAGIAQTSVLGAGLGGIVAQELAVLHPERVSRLVLACTTPGWPFGFPMPAASALLMGALRNLPPETARRSLAENALSPQTLREHPELAERLIEHQRSWPVEARTLFAQTLAGQVCGSGRPVALCG